MDRVKVGRAGTTAKVIFEAKDDNSGIMEFQGGCSPVKSLDSKVSVVGFEALCSMVRHEAGDYYSMEVRVGKWVAPGVYSLAFDPKVVISDKAGNKAQDTHVRVFQFEVTAN